MNKRRGLLAVFSYAALMQGLPALAQTPSTGVKRIGFLAVRARPVSWDNDFYGDFIKGLNELGHVEGKNIILDWRFADGKAERMPDLAKELVAARPDVIVTSGTSSTRAAQNATDTIPIVMAVSADPAISGFNTFLSKPGRNLTGITRVEIEVSPKYLEYSLAAVPSLTHVAVLLNPGNEFYSPRLKGLYEAARAADVRITRVEARTPGEIDSGFKVMEAEGVGGVIVPLDPIFVQYRRELAAAALARRLPSMFAVREHVEVGGLMSYGQNFSELYRRAASYVDKILKGAKPSELPIEQPTKFEVAINLKTAKAIGLEFPAALRASADYVVA
jgi:putative ABC transport system substrate-binding protein